MRRVYSKLSKADKGLIAARAVGNSPRRSVRARRRVRTATGFSREKSKERCMAGSNFVGVDIGTTGARAVRIDRDGRIVASATATYPLLVPRAGWTEQEPEAWWSAVASTLRDVARDDPDAIAALGLTGQMHGAVFLDERGESIRPAILWNDQRTADAAREIEETVGSERLRRITGNRALTGFQAPKILWLREREPQHFERVNAVLLPKDYIRYRLTQSFGSDASDASGTLLFDLARRDWSTEILTALDLPRAWFATVAESPAVTSAVSVGGARETGLPAGLPVVAGAGDNAAAAVGSGVVRRGNGVISLGTSGVLLAHDDVPHVDPSGALHAFCAAVPGAYHLMGVMLAAGGSLRWYRDAFAADTPYDVLTAEAADVEPGAEGVTFLPYLSGERTPHMDPDARGAIVGLRLTHGRGHITRAVLEGVAFGLEDAAVRMRALGVDPAEFVATGNGMSSDLWRAIVGAAIGRPLRRLLVDEGPAFGAALLAGVGAGAYPSVETAADSVVRLAAAEAPSPELVAAYRERYGAFARLYPALHEAPPAVAV